MYRLHLLKASCVARASMRDPIKKKYFWKKARRMKLPNAYTAAISTYLRAEKFKIASPMDPNIFPDRWSVIYEHLKTHVMSAFRVFFGER